MHVVTTKKIKVTPSKRLSGAEREQHITQEAIRFFSEVGFSGDTRELAKRLGVTQSLLYKYFPNKEALVNRVFEVVIWVNGIHFGRKSLKTEASLCKIA
ncbi:MAG: TetR/AcrR family transcriptional regulator [Betaproteobacteria bacterium]|nr:TetR/AcrR family transcriptional regulator [Betaproteobacteria bacterium]